MQTEPTKDGIVSCYIFIFVETIVMAVAKTHKKVTNRPRKVAANKAKQRKGNIEAINKALLIADKYNLDFNYLKA